MWTYKLKEAIAVTENSVLSSFITYCKWTTKLNLWVWKKQQNKKGKWAKLPCFICCWVLFGRLSLGEMCSLVIHSCGFTLRKVRSCFDNRNCGDQGESRLCLSSTWSRFRSNICIVRVNPFPPRKRRSANHDALTWLLRGRENSLHLLFLAN